MAKKTQPKHQAPARMAPARRPVEPQSRDDTALILATAAAYDDYTDNTCTNIGKLPDF